MSVTTPTQIYQGDSLTLLKQADAASVQLTVTSPPYYAYKDYGADPQNIENFKSYPEYCEYLRLWMKELYRVTDEDGRVCIVVDDKHTNLKTEGMNINRATHARFIMWAEEAGFEYKDLIIWAKARAGHASGGSGLMLGSYPYPPNIPCVNWFEYILIFRKPGASRASRVSSKAKENSKLNFSEFKWASESIWKVPPEKNSKHPAPYPKEIPRRLIRLFSFHGDVVLDPFMGSCTTGLVALQEGRQFIGFEINPDFIKMSKARVSHVEQVRHKRYSQEVLV
jgi:DNA modification methylase